MSMYHGHDHDIKSGDKKLYRFQFDHSYYCHQIYTYLIYFYKTRNKINNSMVQKCQTHDH